MTDTKTKRYTSSIGNVLEVFYVENKSANGSPVCLVVGTGHNCDPREYAAHLRAAAEWFEAASTASGDGGRSVAVPADDPVWERSIAEITTPSAPDPGDRDTHPRHPRPLTPSYDEWQ